ncbi:similar to Saccharomyces cerevisiae YIR021W MRS1 Protein required for the splicing of two mitochondrial group I introns (BI3 in COB and AI5beta in COX1) [Maudiozyma saulgeensis]|uniref:Similar to Saccharomyces cerevisiae YIR021W MRS1 Protein required for the splicing of two mitochondrial group I introns (BI3 in COB and AI5beta in COX1) n=1 Tax=Maudiozyma saulgeensis TaxID=1789683 RepID=A0A1X7R9N4_9SACH|nr:similar to Saccharomyces cerevisiae YIR021W MRS1 Protein required for the splicing of two mitochondrial group I introns (BI3 in COB and AI5beta in COX1) [Kazachstania saulgeensis]
MNLPILCKELNSNTLQKLAFLIGAKQDTKKPLRIQNIIDRFKLFNDLSNVKHNNSKKEITITAIDTGIVNCAIASMTITSTDSFRLNYWRKWNLQHQFLGDGQSLTLSPQQTSLVSRSLVSYLLKQPFVNDTSLFTIEKQRARTVSSRVVSDPILKLNIMEHLLYDRLSDHAMIESSDPARMTKFWIPQELQRQHDLKFNSKRARIDLVKSMVFQNSLGFLRLMEPISTQFIQYQEERHRTRMPWLFDALQLQEPLNGARKDDDLADSLLHALAWSQWFKTYCELNQLLLTNPLHSQLNDYIHGQYDQWREMLMNKLKP